MEDGVDARWEEEEDGLPMASAVEELFGRGERGVPAVGDLREAHVRSVVVVWSRPKQSERSGTAEVLTTRR